MEGNDSIIRAAAELIRERAPSDDRPRAWAPQDWREIDLEYPTGQRVVRLTPAGDDATDVEVFAWGDLLLGERVRGYRSAARLAKLTEGILRRAIEAPGR